MSSKGQIYLECLEFRCHSKSRPGKDKECHDYLYRGIFAIYLHAWNIPLLRECQFVSVQLSEPLFCQAESFSSSFSGNCCCQRADSKKGGSWWGHREGHAVGSCGKPGGICKLLFPPRQSLFLGPLVSITLYPNCFSLSDLLCRII